MRTEDKLILELNQNNVTIKDFANNNNISEQTVRNKIKKLNAKNDCHIEISNGVIYSNMEIKIDTKVDVEIVLRYLLLIDSIDVKKLTNIFYISEKTIYKKISDLKNKVSNFDNFVQAHVFLFKYYEIVKMSIKLPSIIDVSKILYDKKMYSYDNYTFDEVINIIEQVTMYRNNIADSSYLQEEFIKFLNYTYLNVNFNQDTINNLKNHLNSHYLNYKYNCFGDEKVSKKFMYKYAEDFDYFELNVRVFFEENGYYINETNIIYLFVIIIQDLVNQYIDYRVIVLCENGTASSHLVANQLLEIFSNIKLIYVGKYSNNLSIPDSINFIITVGQINSVTSDFIVSPILTEEEINCLAHKFRFNDKLNITQYELYLRTLPLLRKNVSFIEFKRNINNKYTNGEIMLKDLIHEEMIVKSFENLSWQDAIRVCGNKLVENGFAKSEYVDAMIKNVYEYGTYIILVPLFALPHSKFSDGSISPAISVLSMDKEVLFPKDKKVKLIMCLSTGSNNEHIKALVDLTKLLQVDGMVEHISNLNDTQEVYQLLNKY